jgi:hypothetical protein
MNAPRIEKLKNVLEAVPSGFIVDSHWLETQGVSRFLTRRYIDSGWLERLGRGVFRRPAPKSVQLDWQTCLLSLQHIMNNKVHVGGSTALGLQGYSHYLPLGGARRSMALRRRHPFMAVTPEVRCADNHPRPCSFR